jgi:hypothetical protein
MKTAMQELIEAVNKHYSNSLRTDIFDTNPYLKKEKEQIIDAYEYGQINVNEDGCLTEENGAEEYYNETYNQDRELPKDVKDMLDNL